MARIRRRGTAIIETKKGILLVAGRSKRFMLPGGNARRSEPRMSAAIREVYEETGLETTEARFLFKHDGGVHNYGGKLMHDKHKIFSLTVKGTPRPRSDAKHIAYFKRGGDLVLSKNTQKILDKFQDQHFRKSNSFST